MLQMKDFMAEQVELTIAEKIDRAKDGRSQTWIVEQMVKKGVVINEVQFSRKKKDKHDHFDEKELSVLSEILSTSFTL